MSGSSVVYDGHEAGALGLNEVADPGASGTIRIDKSPAYVPLESAGAETRTLAVPQGPGLSALLCMETDGGDITLTVTGGFDKAGNDEITFAAIEDFALFTSIRLTGGTSEWRLIASDGVTGTGV